MAGLCERLGFRWMGALALIPALILLAWTVRGEVRPAATRVGSPSRSIHASATSGLSGPDRRALMTESKPLVLWHSFRGDEEEALRIVVSVWNLEHETMPIHLVTRDGATFTDEVEAQIAAGRGPDIFVWAHDKIGAWVEKGLLMPLDRHVDTRLRDAYMPNCLEAMVYRGRLQGLPLSFETLILFYNKKLVPVPPTTTDSLIAVARALRDPDRDRWGLVYERGNFYHHAMWFHGYGARVFDENGDFDVMTPASRRSLEFARDLASIHQAIPDTVDWKIQMDLFNSGRAGMLISGPWAYGSIDRDSVDLGLATLPFISSANAPAAPFLGVKGCYVSSRCRRPADAAAAVAYLTSAYAGYVMNVMSGYMPANQRAYEYSMVAADPVTARFKEQVLTSVPMPSDPRMGYVWKVMMMDNAARRPGCLDKVFARIPADEAVRAAYRDYHRLLRGRKR